MDQYKKLVVLADKFGGVGMSTHSILKLVDEIQLSFYFLFIMKPSLIVHFNAEATSLLKPTNSKTAPLKDRTSRKVASIREKRPSPCPCETIKGTRKSLGKRMESLPQSNSVKDRKEVP